MVERVLLTPAQAAQRLVAHAQAMASEAPGRVALGLAGGPGAGKSTLGAEIANLLNVTHPGIAALVPMDGFHMRHAKLQAMGATDRKGAPHTFEGAAFVNFLAGLKRATDTVHGPGYSREIEDVVDDAFAVPPSVRILVVEGNYLLLPEPPWAGVRSLLDYAVFLDLPRDLVAARLMKRHAEAGLFTEERNRAHIARNDLPNFDLVAQSQDRADLVIALEVEA